MSSRKVRVKKLSVKTGLPVLREDQIDPSEYEALSTETQIATGVEQAEENVSCFHHSQSIVISRALARDIAWHRPLHPITMDNHFTTSMRKPYTAANLACSHRNITCKPFSKMPEPAMTKKSRSRLHRRARSTIMTYTQVSTTNHRPTFDSRKR